MSSSDLKKLWRGPYLKIIITVTKCARDVKEITIDPINIDDMAEVIVNIKVDSKNLLTNLKMKKYETAKMSTILVHITSEEFDEQLVCPLEWVNVPITATKPCSSVVYTDKTEVNTYIIEINILVQTLKPVASVVSNELYDDTELTDFLLVAANGSVAVHKIILFIHSDMFRKMLKGEWKETKECCINFDGVTMQTLQYVKDYMYLGILPDEGLDILLIIALRYLMDKLKADCIAKMIKTVKPEDINKLTKLACENNVPELVTALICNIPDNIINDFHELKLKVETNEQESKEK